MMTMNNPIRQTHLIHCDRFGFTLIEILMTVAILGVAGAMIVPYMANVHTFEVEGSVRQLVADLTYAQSDGLAKQAKRRMLFDDELTGYRLLGDDFTVDEDELYDPVSYHGDNTYIRDFATDDRFNVITVESVDFDDDQLFITYDEMGGPINAEDGPSEGGTIVISGDGESYEIVVAPFTGRVSVNKL